MQTIFKKMVLVPTIICAAGLHVFIPTEEMLPPGQLIYSECYNKGTK
jgi:hypothetical protein